MTQQMLIRFICAKFISKAIDEPYLNDNLNFFITKKGTVVIGLPCCQISHLKQKQRNLNPAKK